MKAAARDRVYGRRGGRWAEDGSGHLADELHEVRLSAVRRRPSEWPEHSLRGWRSLAESAIRRQAEGAPLSELDRKAIEVSDAAGWPRSR